MWIVQQRRTLGDRHHGSIRRSGRRAVVGRGRLDDDRGGNDDGDDRADRHDDDRASGNDHDRCHDHDHDHDHDPGLQPTTRARMRRRRRGRTPGPPRTRRLRQPRAGRHLRAGHRCRAPGIRGAVRQLRARRGDRSERIRMVGARGIRARRSWFRLRLRRLDRRRRPGEQLWVGVECSRFAARSDLRVRVRPRAGSRTDRAVHGGAQIRDVYHRFRLLATDRTDGRRRSGRQGHLGPSRLVDDDHTERSLRSRR